MCGISVRVLSVLLTLGVCLCSSPPEDFVYQYKGQCCFRNGTENVRGLDRYIYNQEEIAYFDSDVGFFIAKTELGKKHFADYWNSQKDLLEQKRAETDTVCRYNYQFDKPDVIDRKSQPNVKIVNSKTLDLEHENLITCFVDGFFPPMIKVTWLKNGIEEGEQVTSSELLPNGDWTFEIHVMLETTIKHGDTFTCRVEHSSLQQPISVNWEPDVSESARNKMLTGIVGFVLGSIFIIVGLVVYLRSKKTMTRFSVVQNENLMS
uniref:Ig-like domain-containing protein n=1 Tax=Xenopus tropicalis TaxID=8364 RepID=Q5M8Y9_XENTR|eukprot:NP_001039259.1 major histocompatibility complex, class II, DR beta 1 precursor [Xenopus tropicalis]